LSAGLFIWITQQTDLFGSSAPPPPKLPDGMRYQADFLSREEEAGLLAVVPKLPLANMQYQQYTARRRVVSYGGQYDFSAQKLHEAEPLPAWLDPQRERAGAWAGIAPECFTQALIAEYALGTPLRWHRDVPDFEDVVDISLLDEAVMRLRPWPHVTGMHPQCVGALGGFRLRAHPALRGEVKRELSLVGCR